MHDYQKDINTAPIVISIVFIVPTVVKKDHNPQVNTMQLNLNRQSCKKSIDC